MTNAEAIALLDALNCDDCERAHSNADSYVLSYLLDNGGKDIVEAYQRVIDRCSWWACA